MVRQALSALDLIAASQGFRLGSGHFSEKGVQTMTTKSVSERQKTFRSRKASLGWQRRMFYLSPEAQMALAAIQSRDGATVDGAMQAALLLLAAGYQAVSPEISQEVCQAVADRPAALALIPLEMNAPFCPFSS
jgi:hypothetical protein